MGKKTTEEQTREYLNSIGFNLIGTYVNENTNVHIIDRDGYQYYSKMGNIKFGKMPNKVSTFNPHTVSNIKLWCSLNNKPFELISEKYEGNDKILLWRCLKEGCGEIFPSIWSNISKGIGCGFCHGFKVGISNCLATVNPQLALEWYQPLNGTLTPYDVTGGSNKIVWWKCSNDKHKPWKSKICGRYLKGNGCPYCGGYYPTDDNNLLICFPEIASEWCYELNKSSPQEFCPQSHKRVWFECKKCHFKWKTAIGNRTGVIKSGCPSCSQSKGEKEIQQFLQKNNIKFEPQKMFDDLRGVGYGLLSYDFYLPDINLVIEFHGIHHEKPIDFDGEGKEIARKKFIQQQEHDKRKKLYTRENKISMKIIWYYEFTNIENILKELLDVYYPIK